MREKQQATFGLLLFMIIFPAWTIGQEPDGERPAVLSAETLFAPDKVVNVEIEVQDEDWDLLRKQGRSMTLALGKELPEKPFTYVPANITVNGQRIEQVGIRKKGFLGSLSENRPSLKIKFSEFRKQSPIEGLSRLTLNNNKQDPSRLNQYLSYRLFNEAGVIAPRCNFAKVTVNGKYLGIYSNVESVKKPFLARFGDDDGALYEGTVVDFFEDRLRRFESKNTNADYKDLQKVARILSEKPIDLDQLEGMVDLEAFLKFWAIESLIGFWDGYTNNQNNFFIYRNPVNKKFNFIPWGLDSSFTYQMPIPPFKISHQTVHSQAILANELYKIPAIQTRYHKTFQNILNEHWDETALLRQVEQAKNLIENHIMEGHEGFAEDVKRVQDFIRSRRTALSREIEAWPVKITTPPRRPFYFEKVGEAQADFSTNWFEKTPRTDPPVGTTDMMLTMNGEPVALTEVSVYVEPDKNRPEVNGKRPPSLVFTGKRKRDGKPILIGVGLNDQDFRPSKEGEIRVEGIYIEGNPLFFFAAMAMGRAQFVLTSGKVRFRKAERAVGGEVEGTIQLDILRTSEPN